MTFIPSPANGIKSTLNTTTTNLGSTTLNGGIDAVVTTIPSVSTTSFPSTGYIKIDSEYISYTSINATNFLGCTRGVLNSTTATHLSGTIIGGTFVGTSELNNIPDVLISCKVDQVGVLYADFSPDNAQWSPYPVLGFSILANVHGFHNAVKGPRYYRTIFVNTSSAPTTSLNIYTYFGVYRQVILPLGQSISNEADTTLTQSINTAKDPSGTYVNTRADGYAFTSTSNLASGASYPSAILNVDGYSQIQRELLSDQAGTLVTTWYSDSLGTNPIAVKTFLYVDVNSFEYSSGPMFSKYVQYIFTNTALNGSTTLNGGIDSVVTTIPVVSTASFSVGGIITIDSEYILYTSKDATTFFGCTRGYNGTTASSHVNGTSVGSYTTQTKFYFAIKLLTGSISGNVLGVTEYVPTTSVANLGRNIIMGQTDGLFFKNVPITGQGHLEIAVHGPINPFGSIHSEPCIPILQMDAVYGLDTLTTSSFTGGSGTVTTSDSMFVTTGGGVTSFATLQSVGRINYRPGQGVVGMFTGVFPILSVSVTDCTRIIGLGQSEDGVYFGYYTGFSEFGILYQNRGQRKVVTITITTGATIAGNLTITLNSIAFTVPVTIGSSIPHTVYEISKFSYKGWSAQTSASNTVVFVSNDSLATYNSGTYSITFSTTGSTGSISSTRNSADPTTQFISQSIWNADNLSGVGGISNPSGVLANWATGNVFKIGIQYLGFGAITFEVEVNSTNNNTTFTTVHTMRLPNTLTKTSFGNPAFTFLQTSKTVTSTDAIIKSGSFGGFIEGYINTLNSRFTYIGTFSTLTPTLTPLYTIQNKIYYNGVANQSTITLISMGASSADTGNTAVASTVYLIRNALLIGAPVFTSYSNSSVSNFSNTSVTIGALSTFDNSQILFSFPLSYSSSQTFAFTDYITLQPGDSVTVCANSVSGMANSVSVSLNTRENK